MESNPETAKMARKPRRKLTPSDRYYRKNRVKMQALMKAYRATPAGRQAHATGCVASYLRRLGASPEQVQAVKDWIKKDVLGVQP